MPNNNNNNNATKLDHFDISSDLLFLHSKHDYETVRGPWSLVCRCLSLSFFLSVLVVLVAVHAVSFMCVPHECTVAALQLSS